jgi:hypothetical protein
MNRCDDKVFVRFQQLGLGVRTTLGSSPRGLFAPVGNLVAQICGVLAPVGNLVAQICGVLAPVSGLFAGKYSCLARGDRRRGRGRASRTLIYFK